VRPEASTSTPCPIDENSPVSALSALPAGGFEVWVTHQVNITALTGEFSSMGQGVLVDASGRTVQPLTFDGV
jgi:hypothetical protein